MRFNRKMAPVEPVPFLIRKLERVGRVFEQPYLIDLTKIDYMILQNQHY